MVNKLRSERHEGSTSVNRTAVWPVCSWSKQIMMASNGVDLAPLGAELAAGADVKENLSRLNVYMEDNRLPLQQRAENVLSAVPLDLLFQLMGASGPKEAELACRLSKKVLNGLPPAALVTSENLPYFCAGLQHPREAVRELGASQVARLVQDRAALQALAASDVLVTALRCIGDESLGVAKHVMDGLVQLAWTPTGLDVLNSAPVHGLIRELLHGPDDNARFRLYESMVRACSISREALNCCRATGLLSRLLEDLNSDDPLTAMNVLELFTTMADNPATNEFLRDSDSLKLVADIVRRADDPTAAVVAVSVFRFWAHLADIQGTDFVLLFDEYQLQDAFMVHLTGTDAASKEAAVTALGHIAGTPSGLQALVRDPQLFKACVQLTRAANDDLRIAALHSVAHILEPKENVPSEVQHQLYALSNGSLLDQAAALGQQPFSGTRYAAYHVLCSLAKQAWGRQELNAHPGLLELVLNRKREVERDGMDWKYAIARAWVQEGEEGAGGAGNYRRLTAYVREGPYYREAPPQVATEQAQ